jgi:hypothetical protein
MQVTDRIPYTYLVKHKKTGKVYYGSRYSKNCHPDDLWKKYFTSSKDIKFYIKKYGKNSFEYQIRKTFNNIFKCQEWEFKVLKRINAVERDDFLNKSNGKGLIKTKNWLTKEAYKRYLKLTSLGHKGIPETEETKKRISEGVKKNWKIRKASKNYKEYCKKISKINSKFKWCTNGKKNIRLKLNQKIPKGYKRGRTI